MNEHRQHPPSADSGGRIRALALLWAAAAIFFFAMILCICLIFQSADAARIPTSGVDPVGYEVLSPIQTIPSTVVNTEDGEEIVTVELEVPVSVNDSTRINILLLGVDGDVNDTLIIAGVDTVERTVSFLSIPRDTYISGAYDLPKAKMVYRSFDEKRRIDAVREAVKGMFGFWTDYYFVLDEVSLSKLMSFTDGLEYEIPSDPGYHGLSSGKQTLTAENAFELFRFNSGWTDVETDPPRVQRYFLQALFAELLQDEKSIAKNCLELAEVARTDLSAGQMAYFAYLLLEFDFENAFSRALPGGEVEIEDVPYYQVNAQKAVEMLNEHFNPLKKDLTVYNVNFRQEQKPSGEGEFSSYFTVASSTNEESGDEFTESGDEESSEITEITESSETEPEETDSDADE